MEQQSFTPDWTERWTAQQAEAQLNGFTFHGPGFYITKDGVLLVIPEDVDTELTWRHKQAPDQVYQFHVYSKRNPCTMFNRIVNAPVRVDET